MMPRVWEGERGVKKYERLDLGEGMWSFDWIMIMTEPHE
jgi:hypothetical protein